MTLEDYIFYVSLVDTCILKKYGNTVDIFFWQGGITWGYIGSPILVDNLLRSNLSGKLFTAYI